MLATWVISSWFAGTDVYRIFALVLAGLYGGEGDLAGAFLGDVCGPGGAPFGADPLEPFLGEFLWGFHSAVG